MLPWDLKDQFYTRHEEIPTYIRECKCYFLYKSMLDRFNSQSKVYSSTSFQEPDSPASPPGIGDQPPHARRACRLQVPCGAWIIGRSLNVRHEPAFAYDVCERTERIRRVERNGASTRERGSTRIFRCSLMTGPMKGGPVRPRSGPDL